MTRAEKSTQIAELEAKIAQTPYLYIMDPAGLTVAQVNRLRRLCFEQNITYRIFKNTLIRKALERQQNAVLYEEFSDGVLSGTSGLLFGDVSAAVIARVILGFHKEANTDIPRFKAACLSREIYQNMTWVEMSQIKGKKERIADVVALLQAPMQQVLGQLQAPQRVLALLSAIEQKKS